MGSLARRLVVTEDADRRRLERALHDGAQQRLAALAATLALAQRRLASGEDGALELVENAGAEAKLCLEDLRELAREIYPAVLAERGLAGALNDVSRRAPGCVEVAAAPEERFAEPVEIAAYLVVSEALSHMGEGDEASVRAQLEGAELVVEVSGVALPADELDALGDRVSALGGRIEASAGVRALLPLEPAANGNG